MPKSKPESDHFRSPGTCLPVDLEDQSEDLHVLSSGSFLRSVEEAREDLRAGRVTRLDELLDG